MVRGPVSLVVVGVISAIFMAMMIGGGPRVFEKVLPAGALAWFDQLGGGDWGTLVAGGTGGRGSDSSDPLAHLDDSSDGWEPDDKIAALPGGGAAFIGDVISGYTTRVKYVKPAEVTAMAEVEGCSFTPPSAGAYLGHASIRAETRMGLPLATYGDADLAAAVAKLVNLYRAKGIVTKSSLSGLKFEGYDIAVTETEKPVYLVLETAAQSRIFNIHLAPGARLERVVLIGGDQVGVANVPAEVPVEAMRAEKAKGCGFLPFYGFNPNHLFNQSVAMGAIRADEAEEKKAHFAELQATWEATFRAAFGAGAAETLSGGWAGGTIATVGPVPASAEARAVYAPLDGAVLRTTVDKYVEFDGQDPEQSFDGRVKAMAKAFAWGDLNNLAEGVAY